MYWSPKLQRTRDRPRRPSSPQGGQIVNALVRRDRLRWRQRKGVFRSGAKGHGGGETSLGLGVAPPTSPRCAGTCRSARPTGHGTQWPAAPGCPRRPNGALTAAASFLWLRYRQREWAGRSSTLVLEPRSPYKEDRAPHLTRSLTRDRGRY